MNANEEMCRCYGYTCGCSCRECLSWEKDRCGRTTGRKKCPAWGTACGRFQQNPDVLAID